MSIPRVNIRFFHYVLLCFSLAATTFINSALAATYNKSDKTILVMGATGKQGGAVARELMKRGYSVRGFTRNPASDRAKALAKLGVDVVKGDFDDVVSLDKAMVNTYGVYAVVDFWEHGYEKEIQQGKNIANAAVKAGVKHFVFSSVAHADEDTGIGHFDSKYQTELYIKSLGLPYTMIRPVSFMENWNYSRDKVMSGIIEGPIDGHIPHQQISVIDIGHFVAEAFDRPDKWIGRSENIAGEQYSRNEIAEIFSRVIGRPIKYKQISWEEFEQDNDEDMVLMERWFAEKGYRADINSLRKECPGMLTLEQYLRKSGWGSNRE